MNELLGIYIQSVRSIYRTCWIYISDALDLYIQRVEYICPSRWVNGCCKLIFNLYVFDRAYHGCTGLLAIAPAPCVPVTA